MLVSHKSYEVGKIRNRANLFLYCSHKNNFAQNCDILSTSANNNKRSFERKMKIKRQQAELMKLISDHQGIVYKICNSYCNNKNDREDLAQEIIYQLLKSYHSFSDQYRFSTWMYRVALNVAISFYRKNKSQKIFYPDEINSDPKDEISHSAELEDNILVLEKYINELKELDKALILLYLESRSYKEISEILGISETNVATKISRVKEILKQKFSNKNN